jgi:aminopeptidase N
VLKQLVAYVGLENFLTGVRSYFDAHAWGNATLGDLLTALEQASGRELASWSKAWLETAGVNTLRAVYETGADGAFTSFSVTQEAPASHPQLRPHRIGIGLYRLTPDGLERSGRVEVDIAGTVTPIPQLAGTPRPDLVLVNDDDLSYAKVRLDEHSLRSLIRAGGRFTESLPAALCWTSSWDMTRDAEVAARDFLTLALTGARFITDINLLQSVLRAAVTSVRRFSDAAWRQAGTEQLTGGLRELMHNAVPGSDRQFCFAITFFDVATAPADLDLLAGLLDGSASIDGLVIDTDQRWRLLHRLVSRGRAGEREIEAELARDDTDAGQRHAASARAAVPTAEAKEEAWNMIIDGGLPSAVVREAIMGFQDLDQAELLAPYREKFFEVIGPRWEQWGDMGRFFAQAAYPMTDISQEAVDFANAYLATPELPAALRRLLAEGRDDVLRALRCRERDALAGG